MIKYVNTIYVKNHITYLYQSIFSLLISLAHTIKPIWYKQTHCLWHQLTSVLKETKKTHFLKEYICARNLWYWSIISKHFSFEHFTWTSIWQPLLLETNTNQEKKQNKRAASMHMNNNKKQPNQNKFFTFFFSSFFNDITLSNVTYCPLKALLESFNEWQK